MWKYIQYASQGRGHVKDQIPCQDKTYCICEGNTTVIALADGAGSARLSHEGAETITRFICEDLLAHYEDYFSNNDGVQVKWEIGEKITQTISAKTAELGCLAHDLASTLLAVAIRSDQYILLHVGDGVIGYYKNGELKVASEPENGEFANTTVFTTSRDFWKSMRLLKGSLGPIEGFVLMSDGTEASMYRKQSRQLAPGIGRLMDMMGYIPTWKVEEQVAHSFRSVIREATIDDCSIVVMAKCPESQEGYASLRAEERKELLRIEAFRNGSGRRLKQTEQLLTVLMIPQTLPSVSAKMHLKPKYLKKRLDRLQKIGVIAYTEGKYWTILNMGQDSVCGVRKG